MTKFVRNPGFEAELQRQASHDAFMAAKATDLVRAIRAGAPNASGYFRRSLGSDGNVVYTTDPFWHLIESGSVHNPPYAPFRRGVRAAGLRLDEILK